MSVCASIIVNSFVKLHLIPLSIQWLGSYTTIEEICDSFIIYYIYDHFPIQLLFIAMAHIPTKVFAFYQV